VSVHSYHPDTHTHGLADDCERCAEHAMRPWLGLDNHILTVLRLRILSELPPRSENERHAMAALKAHDAGVS
jgi:hypothetical protein